MSVRSGLFLLAAAALAPLPAAARTASCSMPEPLRQRICGDSDLARLDAALAAKEHAVAAVTARPATWAARAARFRAWLAADRDLDGEPPSKTELARRIEDRIAELDKELDRAEGLVRDADAAAILGGECLGRWLHMGCAVPASGILREGGTTILWQFQSGASDSDGVGMGAMLWDASGPGKLRLIGWTFEGYFLEMPRFDPERGLLWVAGYMAGTGQANADMLFQKRGDRWIEIEMTSWRDALDPRLPDGLGVWKGVEYDFLDGGMSADARLWKPSDANCCPTGGRANLGFVIEGERLRLDTVSAQIGGPDKPWQDF